MKRTAAAAALLSAVVLLTGCALTGCAASYDERMDYLRKVAQRGADAHRLLVDQEASKIDKDRCQAAYEDLQQKAHDIPRDEDFAEIPRDEDFPGTASAEWLAQVQEFWVDSCVSGKPKPVPGDPVPPQGSPATFR